MPARRRIPIAAGSAALATWSPDSSRETEATAVRFALEELATRAPGRSVEVRVPPHGAVQCIAGSIHRRGTPPAVVEMGPATFVRLARGQLTWADAVRSGAVSASGERADLDPYLPLVGGAGGSTPNA